MMCFIEELLKKYLVDMKAKVNSNSISQKYVYEKQVVEEIFYSFETNYSIINSLAFKEEISSGLSVDIYGVAEASLVTTISSEQRFDSSFTIREYLSKQKKNLINEKYEFEFNPNNKSGGFYVIGLFCDADFYSMIIEKDGSYEIVDYLIPQNITLSCLFVGNESTNKPSKFDFKEIDVNKIKKNKNITNIKLDIDTDVYYVNPNIKINYGDSKSISFDLSNVDYEKYSLLGYRNVCMNISHYIASDYHLFNWGTSANVSIKLDTNKIYEKSDSVKSSSSIIFAYDSCSYAISDFMNYKYIITEVKCVDVLYHAI